MSLTDEALAEYQRELAVEQAAADAAQRDLRLAATAALKAVLTRADGTSLTLSEAGLSAVDVNLEDGRVVYSDKTVSLAAVFDGTGWTVSLVSKDSGEWVRESEPLTDLSDLGAALNGG